MKEKEKFANFAWNMGNMMTPTQPLSTEKLNDRYLSIPDEHPPSRMPDLFFPISYRNQGIDVYDLWSMDTIVLIFIDLYAVKFPDSFYWSLLDIGLNVGLMFFLVRQGCNTQFHMSHSLRL